MGYDCDKNKGSVINHAEAEIVKRIFSDILEGKARQYKKKYYVEESTLQ